MGGMKRAFENIAARHDAAADKAREEAASHRASAQRLYEQGSGPHVTDLAGNHEWSAEEADQRAGREQARADEIRRNTR